MALDLKDCTFFGPALPEPFVKFDLENLLNKDKLLPSNVGIEGKQLQNEWDNYRRKLRDLGEQGGPIRVINHVFEPLIKLLGYDAIEKAESVTTREDSKNGEDGGYLITTSDKTNKLRVWTVEVGIDLDAPNKRGRAYRFSPSRIAQRVLLAKSERVGLLTDGQELRLLICDPARPDSHIVIRLDRGEGGWRSARNLPDSFRLLLALASPKGIAKVPDLTEKARLSQTEVTKTLRLQARQAVEGFVQGILDNPKNRETLTLSDEYKDKNLLAKQLWSEGLIFVYRLLFVFKLESSADPARAFSFASTSLWRNTYSPNTALAKYAREVIDKGAETGQMLEAGLRVLFRLFAEGLSVNELNIKPLGGMLFGSSATKLIDNLAWGEQAVATLLDKLLWTPKGKIERQRVHYGSLDVEDLGRVYEALLELEPGIATEPMCRLRRQKLEVVVPIAQGERYRTSFATKTEVELDIGEDELEDLDNEEDSEEQTSSRSKKTVVKWIDPPINTGHFYLRVGLGRKASGSYYTPHAFVRFLVQETLGVQVAERSPANDPKPMEILKLKALDPAMGSGHFLVEACRFLGEKLYEACRLCDELASEAEEKAEKATSEIERKQFEERAIKLINRVKDLPDPNDELLAYLPSRVVEGEESGLSQWKALALCRRLIAVHCLYGVDKNPLAVELAKLSLWLESYAEGLPLTFLDHRLICGDSLTGPFFEHLLTYPGSGERFDEMLFVQDLTEQIKSSLNEALSYIEALEASIGKDVADIENKRAAKVHLDIALNPFKLLAAAWVGGVILGKDGCDNQAYEMLLKAVAQKLDLDLVIEKSSSLQKMINVGSEGIAYDLVFPEVFYSFGEINKREGFDAIIGNPPWSKLNLEEPAFLASFDIRAFEMQGNQRASFRKELEGSVAWETWQTASKAEDRYLDCLRKIYFDTFDLNAGAFGGADLDICGAFFSRSWVQTKNSGYVGMVLPSAIHSSKSLKPLRKNLLYEVTLKTYFCFENMKEIFEIAPRWKFTPVVTYNAKPSREHSFPAQFYLHDLEWLFSQNKTPKTFLYSADTISSMDPEHLVFQEFTSLIDADIATKMYSKSISFGTHLTNNHIHLRRELDATDDSWRLDHTKNPRKPLEVIRSGLIHHKPGTIHQYTDLWCGAETALVPFGKLKGKESVLNLALFYRTAYRVQARATDERTSIFCLLPPGTTATNKIRLEGEPSKRRNWMALTVIGIANTFPFDWGLRLRTAGLTISKYIIEITPFLDIFSCQKLLPHSVLRLSCNYEDYAPLWDEQVGNEWRETNTPPFSWPVLATEDERWAVRAAIDAVVADAYGLSYEQYKYVLSTFSHKSYPKAPALCLEVFDELKTIGLEEFTKKHDPYWDIPINEELPKPVIELPKLSEELLQEDPTGKKKKKGKNAGQMSFFDT